MQKNIRNTLFNPEFPAGFFLDPSEQEQLVAGLVYYDMIKMDNSRRLPLANGGLTDIYINIRESRKFAEGVAFLSDRYAVALKRLGVNRIADVPLAVSNLSGSIQERLGIPAITIREEAKPGRATQGVIIGDMRPGEIIGMYDDVMTDGKSKIKPYYAITAKGGTPYLVIMVDRMQGWRQKFTELGINLPTWAGTDLHTVRRHLINTFGLMQRCEPEMEEKNPFIWALDGMDWDTALPLMDILRPTGAILKMNNLLHNQERSHIVRDVHTYGRTMIDFKGSDTRRGARASRKPRPGVDRHLQGTLWPPRHTGAGDHRQNRRLSRIRMLRQRGKRTGEPIPGQRVCRPWHTLTRSGSRFAEKHRTARRRTCQRRNKTRRRKPVHQSSRPGRRVQPRHDRRARYQALAPPLSSCLKSPTRKSRGFIFLTTPIIGSTECR
ncbi:MAG: hypothetical protein UY19_C0005G0022 [Candidatus Wolfebacteria bacterium GW2011_GWA2_47_9b]|uniref:Orotate phosphoribosyltransferase n=1 Tax=Candidatus Wolfebacteria bacterium GW2011_GWA2_47_9b TaxID=1619005 RepID=A0A0G1U816_9BACT|nr:MAG: hypothetical protein UY19_C0005G0022 [Candidatus Wolfebacteria bacterium GW2011_GWA2_47_9b]